MHFLFPIPSVETVFPVSDLHCPFQATPSWARTHMPAPLPSGPQRHLAGRRSPAASQPGKGEQWRPPPPPWGGRGRRQHHVCKGISWGRESNPQSSWRFSPPPARAPRRIAAWSASAPNASWTATAQEFGEPQEARHRALCPDRSRPRTPPASPALPPPPESLTTAGPRRPRLPGARPPPPPTTLPAETKPSGRLPPSPSVVSGERRGPRLAPNSSSRPTPDSEGPDQAPDAAPCRARAPQPGPGSSQCTESWLPPFCSLRYFVLNKIQKDITGAPGLLLSAHSPVRRRNLLNRPCSVK
jgi:hypothetical protein